MVEAEGDGGGVEARFEAHSFGVHLILAIDHSDEGDELAVVKFRVARGTAFLDLLFEAEPAFVAADDTRQADGGIEFGDILEHAVQLDAGISFLLHNHIFFATQKSFMFHRASPVSSFKYGVR